MVGSEWPPDSRPGALVWAAAVAAGEAGEVGSGAELIRGFVGLRRSRETALRMLVTQAALWNFLPS